MFQTTNRYWNHKKSWDKLNKLPSQLVETRPSSVSDPNGSVFPVNSLRTVDMVKESENHQQSMAAFLLVGYQMKSTTSITNNHQQL